ncbi:tripartite tricarboxylate transporter TctB family protein [Acidimangrovimonas sediminis]|uniref:tripartite tricarboxylate transporter TctB family protein n=1 Tax=Acidimangrovimonas sediminis TaxID=2056283 RepID=UPI000C7FA622|nr:tripartite tricarboxylate transporter TctB family protein [Acidimangrovimonas sediminis]
MMEHSRKVDVAIGTVLALIGLAWTLEVVRTIPAGTGGGDVGPRAFPLLYGVLLIVLSAGWALSRLLLTGEEAEAPPPRPAQPSSSAAGATEEDATPEAGDTPRARVVALALTLFVVLLYGWLMTRVGFLTATFAVVLFAALVVLRERRPVVVAGMAVGVTAATWLIFEVILGIPLATGSWINLG